MAPTLRLGYCRDWTTRPGYGFRPSECSRAAHSNISIALKQIEDLIEMANGHRAIPQIALYCYEASTPNGYCCRRRQAQHYGCTVVPAEFALNELRCGRGPGKITVSDLAHESHPWRCLCVSAVSAGSER